MPGLIFDPRVMRDATYVEGRATFDFDRVIVLPRGTVTVITTDDPHGWSLADADLDDWSPQATTPAEIAFAMIKWRSANPADLGHFRSEVKRQLKAGLDLADPVTGGSRIEHGSGKAVVVLWEKYFPATSPNGSDLSKSAAKIRSLPAADFVAAWLLWKFENLA